MPNVINLPGPERSGYNKPLVLDARTGPAYQRVIDLVIDQPPKSIAGIETIEALANWSTFLGPDIARLVAAVSKQTPTPFGNNYSYRGDIDGQRKIAVGLFQSQVTMRYWSNRPNWIVEPGLDGLWITFPTNRSISRALPDEVELSVWSNPKSLESDGRMFKKIVSPHAYRLDYSPLQRPHPREVFEYTRRLRYAASRFIQTIQIAQ